MAEERRPLDGYQGFIEPRQLTLDSRDVGDAAAHSREPFLRHDPEHEISLGQDPLARPYAGLDRTGYSSPGRLPDSLDFNARGAGKSPFLWSGDYGPSALDGYPEFPPLQLDDWHSRPDERPGLAYDAPPLPSLGFPGPFPGVGEMLGHHPSMHPPGPTLPPLHSFAPLSPFPYDMDAIHPQFRPLHHGPPELDGGETLPLLPVVGNHIHEYEEHQPLHDPQLIAGTSTKKTRVDKRNTKPLTVEDLLHDNSRFAKVVKAFLSIEDAENRTVPEIAKRVSEMYTGQYADFEGVKRMVNDVLQKHKAFWHPGRGSPYQLNLNEGRARREFPSNSRRLVRNRYDENVFYPRSKKQRKARHPVKTLQESVIEDNHDEHVFQNNLQDGEGEVNQSLGPSEEVELHRTQDEAVAYTQLAGRQDDSQLHTADRSLPPNPAYYRRRDFDIGRARSPQAQVTSEYPAISSAGNGYNGNDAPISPASNHVPSSAATDHRRFSPQTSQYSSAPDSYHELTDQFNQMSVGERPFSDPAQEGYQGVEHYNYAENLDSTHQQYARSTDEAYAYGADSYTDASTSQHYNQNGYHQWVPNGYERSASLQAQPPRAQYDPFIAAASNVLGGGPPAEEPLPYFDDNRAPPPDQLMPHGSSVQEDIGPPSDGQQISRSSSRNLFADDDQAFNQLSAFTEGSILSSNSSEERLRPALHRSGTTSSVSLGTRKMKAVDLRAPPYTKEFIEEYRQRIKNDPDPEAHFQYAKYLIDAARNIGANASDQRAVRKYRELLVQDALKVIRRLATQGEPYAEAQFFLANCHGTGMLGLQVDHERAYHLYLQAAKQNHSSAAYRVAVCNEIGAGTRREPPRAFAFYRKSASLGDTAAMYKLGMVLLNGGLGQPANPREGVAWLRRAAEQADEDNPHALHELGLLHENPESKIVPYDPLYAKNLFTKAAQLGYSQSQFKLGQCYEYGTLTCAVDPRRSIGWYTKAAEKGNAEAELALSGWYLTGSEGVLKQSDSEAYLWARRAANKGLSTAEYAVGYFSEIGIGVKQDIELAKRWYMRSAAQGNKRAMNRLTELKRMGNKRGLAIRPTRQQAKDECIIA